MTDAVGQISLQKLALAEAHAQLGAAMTECDGWSVPASYGDVTEEYAAVRDGGAGVIDLSSRGRLLVSGSEAVPFLNGLITNDMKTLAEHSWMPAAFPNVQGRLLASVRVIRLKDEGGLPTFLMDTEAATHENLLKTIERFTLAGDFRVNDITSETALLSVQGAKAKSAVASVLASTATTTPNSVRQVSWQQEGTLTDVTVVQASHTGEDGIDLIVNNDQADGLWNALQRAGARPVGYDALEILRIEAGIPRYGVDMDETNVVTETNLDDAVSYTKGCYIGQEIIARIKYRGHVAKKLTGLVLAANVQVNAGSVVNSIEGKEIGRVTSVTSSPRLSRTIALAYVKYDYLAADTAVKVVAGEREFSGNVVELPFVSVAAA